MLKSKKTTIVILILQAKSPIQRPQIARVSADSALNLLFARTVCS